MTVYKILKYPHVLLRKKSTQVEKFSDDLKTFVQGMVNTMNAFDGIGLAAPQVGILKRVFIMDLASYLANESLKDWHGSHTLKINGTVQPIQFPFVFINPIIARSEGEILFPFDGCLSFPGLERGDSARLKFIEVHAKTIDGKDVVLECEGIMSICVQHEMDHLDGILFIDRLRSKIPDKDVIAEVKEFEDSSEYRKSLKKIHPTDARDAKFGFL